MRTKASVVALFLVVFAAACGRGYPQEDGDPTPSSSASALDPVGMYDFTATLGSESRTGTIDIRRTENGYGGQATLEGESDAAILDSLRVDGNRMVIDLTVSGGPVVFELDFTGAAFTGFIFADEDAISVTGAKRAD